MNTTHQTSALDPAQTFKRARSNLLRIIISLNLLITLHACGFQPLALNNSEAPHRVMLTGNTDNPIVEHMHDLQPVNVQLISPSGPSSNAHSAEQADLNLEIGDIQTARNVLSQTNLGITSEYRISMSVQIQATDAKQNKLLAPTKLTTYRNQIVANGYATAEYAELERLYTDMSRELANSIYYRLRAIKSAQTAQTAQTANINTVPVKAQP